MIFKSKEGLELPKWKVNYTDKGNKLEKEVGEEGQEWWIEFAERWDHVEIIEFLEIAYTSEQLARFEEVKELKVSEQVLNDYVENGFTGKGLEVLGLIKENEQLQNLLADLTELILMGGM